MPDVLDRMRQLQNAGYAWLPEQTLFSLVNSGLSDAEVQQTAEGMRKASVQGDVKRAQGGDQAAKGDDGFKQFFADPVLQQKPSAALAIKEYLTGAVGQSPVGEQSLTKIQQNLQQRGFGRDLDTNGAWSPAWQAAKVEYLKDVGQKAQAGEKSGGWSPTDIVSAIKDLSPTEAWNATIGFVKSVPADLRMFAADVYGSAAFMGYDLAHGSLSGTEKGAQFGGTQAAGLESALGGEGDPQKQITTGGWQLGVQHLVNDIGTVYLLSGAGKATGRLGSAIFENGAKDAATVGAGDLATTEAHQAGGVVSDSIASSAADETPFVRPAGFEGATGTAAETTAPESVATGTAQTPPLAPEAGMPQAGPQTGAPPPEVPLSGAPPEGGMPPETAAGAEAQGPTYRGPGVIARNVAQPLLKTTPGHVILGAGVGGGVTALEGGDRNEILAGMALGAGAGALASTDVFKNLPVIRDTGPVVSALADEDGLYYQARRLLATPYRYKAVQVAGEAMQESQMFGLKARGIANLSGIVGGQPGDNAGTLQPVKDENVIDTVNDAIKHRLSFTVLGQEISPSVDDLMFVLHGAPGASQAVVGQEATDAVNGSIDALGGVGNIGAIERATGKSWSTLVKDAGSPDRASRFWNDKIAYHASRWGAEQQLATDADRMAQAGQIPNPEVFAGDVANFDRAAQLNDYTTAIRNDPGLLKDAVTGLRAQRGNDELVIRLKREIATSPGDWNRQGIQSYLDASDTVNQQILPNKDQLLNAGDKEGALGIAHTGGPVEADSVRARLGIDHSGTLTRQDAYHAANTFEHRYNDLELRKDAAIDASKPEEMGATAPEGGIPLKPPTEVPGPPVSAAEASTSVSPAEEAAAPGEAGQAPVGQMPVGETPATPGGAPSIAEYQQLQSDLADFLHGELGIREWRMPHSAFGGDGLKSKIDVIRDTADSLAADVYLKDGADPNVVQAVGDLQDNGWKLVSGTDIGHVHVTPSAIDALEGPLTFQRRLAGHLGMDPELIPNRNIWSHREAGILNAVQGEVDAGNVQLPPYWDAQTVLAYLKSDGVIDSDPGRVRGGLMGLFNTPGKAKIAEKAEQLRGEMPGASEGDVMASARQAARDEVTAALQLRDVPRGKFVEALTNPAKFEGFTPEAQAAKYADYGPDINAALSDTPAFSENDANVLYGAVRKGSADVPGYLLGASKLEDMFRASMGFAGKGRPFRAAAGAALGGATGAVYASQTGENPLEGAEKGAIAGGIAGGLTSDRLGYAMANIPNRLIQLRNDLRFELSPMFSFRRYAKTNLKLGMEGIDPAWNPYKKMVEAGTLNDDRAALRGAFPEFAARDVSDDADRYLKQQDIFTPYNLKDFEAYAAGKWARDGLDSNAIRDKVIHTFEYGTQGEAGRSALERSTNFIFFPFSFDKTLYRNVGGYLLDAPAQRLLFTRALGAYSEFNSEHMDGSNPLATSFYTKHLPILEEAANLNAFAHGVSLGEPGGINRPLLNLFLPQSWNPTGDNLDTLKRFVPVVKDFSRVWQESQDQAGIAHATWDNAWRDLHGIPATWGNPTESTLNSKAQIEDAFKMQAAWFKQYQNVLDYNSHQRDKTAQVKFPLSPEWGNFAGEPVTKANIREIIHMRYPSYDPLGAVNATVLGQEQYKDWVRSVKADNPQLADYAQKFSEAVSSLGNIMSSNTLPAADVAKYTDQYRTAGIWLAERDPKFLKLYRSQFARILGPLEQVT